MANELIIRDPTLHGLTLYARVYSGIQVWYTVTPTFENFTTAHVASYSIAMTETSGSSGEFKGDFPTGIVTLGTYDYEIFQRVGGSAAETDPLVSGVGSVQWDGAQETTGATLAASQPGVTFDSLTVTNNFDVFGNVEFTNNFEIGNNFSVDNTMHMVLDAESLAAFVLVDTDQTSASDGSVAKLAQGSGGGGAAPTTEEIWTYASRTLTAVGPVIIISPVNISGDTLELIAGDAYLTSIGNEIAMQIPSVNLLPTTLPDGTTVALKLLKPSDGTSWKFSGAITVDGVTKTVTFDMAAADTAVLPTGRGGDVRFQVEFLVGGDPTKVVTASRGFANVMPRIPDPS